MRSLITIAAIFMIIAGIAEGHPGRLDKYGGHYDKSTGTYHTHETNLSTLEIRRATIYKAHVDRVVDGDTIIASFIFDDGSEYQPERVRFIGLDTPEKGKVKLLEVGDKEITPQEVAFTSYGETASEYTTEELTGKTIWLETETEVKDRYGRMLAYIWLQPPEEDELSVRENMFNARLLLGGYARLLTIAPNSKYTNLFEGYAQAAQIGKRGIWDY